MIFFISASGQQRAEDWFNKGNALYIQNKYDEAIKAFDKAIELNPKHAIAWNSKGNMLKARISTVSWNTWTDYRSMGILKANISAAEPVS